MIAMRCPLKMLSTAAATSTTRKIQKTRVSEYPSAYPFDHVDSARLPSSV